MKYGGFRVALVDSDERSMKVMQRMIEELVPDAETHLFTTSEQAIDYIQRFSVAAVFLETRTQRLNGLKLAKRLKLLRPRINLIFVTMYDQYKDEAIWLHASGYVLKPFSTADIARQLTNLLYPSKQIEEIRPSIESWLNSEQIWTKRGFFL